MKDIENLKIEDELERALSNWGSLDRLEKAHIKILLRQKEWKDHPYAQLLREAIPVLINKHFPTRQQIKGH